MAHERSSERLHGFLQRLEALEAKIASFTRSWTKVEKDEIGRELRALHNSLADYETVLSRELTLESFVRDIPVPAYVFHWGNRKLIASNDHFEELLGYQGGEAKQLSLEDLRPPEDVPLMLEGLSTTSTDGELERRYRRKDGKLLRVRLKYSRMSHSLLPPSHACLVVVTETEALG